MDNYTRTLCSSHTLTKKIECRKNLKYSFTLLKGQDQKQQLCRPIGYETDILKYVSMFYNVKGTISHDFFPLFFFLPNSLYWSHQRCPRAIFNWINFSWSYSNLKSIICYQSYSNTKYLYLDSYYSNWTVSWKIVALQAVARASCLIETANDSWIAESCDSPVLSSPRSCDSLDLSAPRSCDSLDLSTPRSCNSLVLSTPRSCNSLVLSTPRSCNSLVLSTPRSNPE